jgi:hypothetical protein
MSTDDAKEWNLLTSNSSFVPTGFDPTLNLFYGLGEPYYESDTIFTSPDLLEWTPVASKFYLFILI